MIYFLVTIVFILLIVIFCLVFRIFNLKDKCNKKNLVDYDDSKNSLVVNLDYEKEEVFDLIEKDRSNYLILGNRYTNKNGIINYLRENSKKKILFCTGREVDTIDNTFVSIKSCFGWNNLIDEGVIDLTRDNDYLLKNIDCIVIDNISLVRVDVFNQIDLVLKTANNNSLPFGGKQIILFGDLFNSLPVIDKCKEEFFKDKFGGINFFDAPAYKNGNFIHKELREVVDKKNYEFFTILDDIKMGNITCGLIESLNKHYKKEIDSSLVHVVTMDEEADYINKSNLEKINSKSYEYDACILKKGDNFIRSDFPCNYKLELKLGALIMMITDDCNGKWVKGDTGYVISLTKDSIKIRINNYDCIIKQSVFNKYKCSYDSNTLKLVYEIESSVKQYPLVLGYSITISKSIGFSFNYMTCNVKKCSNPLETYSYLARCRNYDNLVLGDKIDGNCFIIDSSIVNFNNLLKKKLD